MASEEKAIKCIVLDAGPLILNDPSISTLLAKSEQLYCTNSVLAEIRDPDARNRLQTTVLPFLAVRDPSPASVKLISDFARKTGDLPVLSRTDLQVIALAYELECEKNGGNWRLRSVPGQKTLNGPPPAAAKEGGEAEKDGCASTVDAAVDASEESLQQPQDIAAAVEEPVREESLATEGVTNAMSTLEVQDGVTETNQADRSENPVATPTEAGMSVSESTAIAPATDAAEDADSGSDSDGEWITPSNLSSRLARDTDPTAGSASTNPRAAEPVLQVATLTTDFALQNVLLAMNLNLLSPRLSRVRKVRSHVLRCHACFAVSRDLTRQFCSRCGQPALTRVACSSSSGGDGGGGSGGGLVLHLRKNFQHNKRGDKYSIPKPVAGSASGKPGKGKGGKGGGQHGWGSGLILTEDQKEYTRALSGRGGRGAGSERQRGLDEDYLPGILTGRRDGNGGAAGGRPKVGAGRNVNSKKR